MRAHVVCAHPEPLSYNAHLAERRGNPPNPLLTTGNPFAMLAKMFESEGGEAKAQDAFDRLSEDDSPASCKKVTKALSTDEATSGQGESSVLALAPRGS